MADLTDAQWEYVKPFVKWDEQQRQRPDRRGGRWSEPRRVLNGVLWILRTGAPTGGSDFHQCLNTAARLVGELEYFLPGQAISSSFHLRLRKAAPGSRRATNACFGTEEGSQHS